MTSPIAALLAGVLGGIVGWFVRRWLATLRRGTVVPAGGLEVPSALISVLGMLVTFDDGPWPLVLWIGLLGVPLAVVDVRHHRLPDALTLPAVPLTLLGAVLTAALVDGSGSVVRAAAGGAILGVVFFGAAYGYPRGMGRGDAKLSISIGIALGFVSWTALIVGLLLVFGIGALIGLAGLVIRRLALSSAYAFGPALLLGCWLTLALSGVLLP